MNAFGKAALFTARAKAILRRTLNGNCRDMAASPKYVAVRFLKMFGERLWGNDRKYIRSSLPNGGSRYAPARPNRNEGKPVALLASAFREMRRRISRPAVSIQRSLQQVKVIRG